MSNHEKEADLRWILENHRTSPMGEVVERLEALLGIDFDTDTEANLEARVEKALGRDLTPDEVYALRPLLMDVENNYYGEE